jgi:DNA polymerase (family 10)
MENPHVDCIGHLTARKIGRRSGAAIDPGRVIEVAARTGTALEINSQPDRLDMPDPLARLAGEEGVLVPVTSDAHRESTLAYVELGIGLARRAWLTKKQVLNTRSWAQIEKTLER